MTILNKIEQTKSGLVGITEKGDKVSLPEEPDKIDAFFKYIQIGTNKEEALNNFKARARRPKHLFYHFSDKLHVEDARNSQQLVHINYARYRIKD